LEKYGPQADLPLEWIAKEVSRMWGPGKRAWLSEEAPSPNLSFEGRGKR